MSQPVPALLRTVAHHAIKVWGGDNLIHHFDKPVSRTQRATLDVAAPIGESWDAADLPEGQSFVLMPDGRELTLHQCVEQFGEAIMGRAQGHYPLLIKTLDAARDLSIQVHPGAEHLHMFEQPHVAQKDECWLILAAAPGGSILHGFARGVTRDDFARAVAAREDLSSLMRRHEVTPGEVVHVPPGTVHAICAGVTLLEVQQPSDTTFRVWDYDRPGLDGHLRPLHLEQAMKVLNFGAQPDVLTHTSRRDAHVTVLVETPHYRLTRLDPGDGTLALGDHLRTRAHATSLFTLDAPARVQVEHDAHVTLDTYSLTLCTTTSQDVALHLSGAPVILIEALQA